MDKIAVLIPCYNESKTIEKVVTDFKKAFYLDLYGFLSHNFIVADKSSMQASIEMRVPLINKELVVKNFYENENKLLDFFHTKKQLKKILQKAGIWFIKMPERFAPNYFIEIASFLAMTLRS